MREEITHTLAPIFNSRSRVLLLGTMPSPASRRNGFYYGHPQNRMWRVLANVLEEELPVTIEQKIDLLLRRGIALWDVLAACTIQGADDSSIRDALPNDLSLILGRAPVAQIFTTGQKAGQLYGRLCQPHTGRPAVILPSTSPANCRLSLEQLEQSYRAMLPFLQP